MRRPQPGHRVRDVLLGGQPLEELLQGAELVAGVGGAVPAQQPGHPLLDILPPDVSPAGTAGLPAQVRGGEPSHRLGVGPDRPGSFALGSQVQPERADLRLESASVQQLGLPGRGLRCDHDLPLVTTRTTRSRSLPETFDPQHTSRRGGTLPGGDREDLHGVRQAPDAALPVTRAAWGQSLMMRS